MDTTLNCYRNPAGLELSIRMTLLTDKSNRTMQQCQPDSSTDLVCEALVISHASTCIYIMHMQETVCITNTSEPAYGHVKVAASVSTSAQS